MSIATWLAAALHPCIHEWEVTIALRDREVAPTRCKLVFVCPLCATTKTEDHSLPVEKGHQHRWEEEGRTKIFPQGSAGEGIPIGEMIQQKCLCGDMRALKITTNGIQIMGAA